MRFQKSQILAKPTRKSVYIRDFREHRRLDIDRKLAEVDWYSLYDCDNVDDVVCKLEETLTMLFEEWFPKIKVKTSSRDTPFMSPLVKHLCSKRYKNIKKELTHSLEKIRLMQ